MILQVIIALDSLLLREMLSPHTLNETKTVFKVKEIRLFKSNKNMLYNMYLNYLGALVQQNEVDIICI